MHARPLVQLVFLAASCAAAAAGVTARAAAQAPATAPLDVVVRGPGSTVVVGAQVTAGPVRTEPGLTFARAGTSDDLGRVRLPGLPVGLTAVTVRRIGYRPLSLEVTLPVAGTEPLALMLEAVPQQLATVVVRANRRGRYTGHLADFQRRRDLAIGGRFFTAEDIDARHPVRTTDMLRMLPGMNVMPSGNGVTNVLRIRGNRCDPFVWIDGAPAMAGYLDVDTFAPNSLAGIEVYSGVATVPVELRGPRGEGSCGVIALWTRMPEPRARRAKKAVTAEDLAALVASATVYTADQVDRAATLDTTEAFDLAYPDSLRRNGVSGEALVEFVVDAEGKVEWETVGVVAATHLRFGDAARVAARTARFIPAQKAGRAVRQLAQLPLRWDAK